MNALIQDFLHEEWPLLRLAALAPATHGIWAVLMLWAWEVLGHNLQVAWLVGGAVYLGAVAAVADAQTRRLPLWPMGLLALIAMVAHPLGLPLVQALMGGVIAGAAVTGIGWLASRLSGRPALGAGDVWLCAALGAWLGPLGLLPWLLLVGVLGLGVVLVRRALGRCGAFAFGPVLLLAAFVSLFHGHVYFNILMPGLLEQGTLYAGAV